MCRKNGQSLLKAEINLFVKKLAYAWGVTTQTVRNLCSDHPTKLLVFEPLSVLVGTSQFWV